MFSIKLTHSTDQPEAIFQFCVPSWICTILLCAHDHRAMMGTKLKIPFRNSSVEKRLVMKH